MSGSGEATPPAEMYATLTAEAHLSRLVRRARLALAVEKYWPWLVAAASLAALFLILALSGLWVAAPVWLRGIGVGLFSFLILSSLLVGLQFVRVTRAEALKRIDAQSGLAHQPATTYADHLANAAGTPATHALWQAHQQRISRVIATLKVHPPCPDLATRDPYALRFAILLAFCAAFLVAGPERAGRVLAAFDWSTPRDAGKPMRLDGWINPPAYTGLPPVMIDFTRVEPRTLRVPVGSALFLRASVAGIMEPAVSGSITPIPAEAATEGQTWQWQIKGDSTLALRHRTEPLASLSFTIIPDQPPKITFDKDEPSASGPGTVLSYSVSDDYGVASGEIRLANPTINGTSLLGKRPPLVPPPEIPLTLPADPRSGEAKTTIDLSDSPWGGTTLDLTLGIRDNAALESLSNFRSISVQQRPFTSLLARAIVEQRRLLLLNPDKISHVIEALNAFLIAPEWFTPEPFAYLGLRSLVQRASAAKSDADLVQVAENMWELALSLEEFTTGDAEKALKAARDALSKAFDRGADDAEIKALTQKLREAMNKYIKELAENMAKNRSDENRAGQPRKPDQTIRQEDLNAMLDRLETMARRGGQDEARQALAELGKLLDALKSARAAPGDPSAGEIDKSLDALDRLTREQQQLRDETFQGFNGKEALPDRRSLNNRQRQLREQLDALQRQLGDLGIPSEPGFDAAQEAMKQAEGALGEGDGEAAVDGQGQALENLRKGSQNLAKQLGNGRGNRFGRGEAPGRGDEEFAEGNDSDTPSTDPLGRSTSKNASENAKMRSGGRESSIEQRTREVQEEVRRRLGEPQRPIDERNYLERLIGPR
ncbi:MAG: TIGR02302 family protein [Hyphomicrobiales bacterium]